MKAKRTALAVVLAAACISAALITGAATHGAPAASAAGPCQLGGKNGAIKHVIYLQFDNTHFRRDVANVPPANMVTDGGATTPAPWLTFTGAGCSVGGVSAANIELENNNAVTVRGGPTALIVATPAGATNIKVASVAG